MAAASSGLAALAERYAMALYELAEDKKVLDSVSKDAQSLNDLLSESSDLLWVVSSRTLSGDQAQKGVMAVLEKGNAHNLTKNFIALLGQKGRLYALQKIIAAYLALAAKRRGEVTATVVAAKELSATQMGNLVTELSKVYGNKVSIDLTVDSSLIGGMIVKVGSRMIDSSLRGKLQRLQYAMKGVG